MIAWDRLVSVLDYHEGKWYRLCSGEWCRVTQQSVHDECVRCGYDVERVIKLFRYRDRESTARHYPRT
jgi:hypothetical protein